MRVLHLPKVIGGHPRAVAAGERALGYDARLYVEENRALKRVLDAIVHGDFSPGEPERYRGLIESLLNRDTYLLMADFTDYVATQARVDALWRDPSAWAQCAIRNVAAMGPFSSDRTIREYMQKVWTAPARR